MSMTGINAFLFKIFGASWFTSLIGYIVMAGGGALLVQDAIAEQGVPTDGKSWLAFVIGLALRFTKQSNVSNAQKPMAVAQPVVAETGAALAVEPVPQVKP